MKRFLFAVTAIFQCVLSLASAHDEPTSFLELRPSPHGIDATFTASTTDLAHELDAVSASMLLEPSILTSQRTALFAVLQERLTISADGTSTTLEPGDAIPIPEKKDIQMRFRVAWNKIPETIQLHCLPFPYDQRHRVFLTVRQEEAVDHAEILDAARPSLSFTPGHHQDLPSVIQHFTVQGIHHIFIGPDHILFIAGLLLLGGSVRQLFRIVTAFTIAHSITLCLATFEIVSPPASLIEPVIALSIIAVGIHAMLKKSTRDIRIVMAFGFGLIHGFGFAFVLQNLALPVTAMGWALFSFNVGVELGQAAIVLAVAPALALLLNKRPAAGILVTNAMAILVVTSGVFWFFQRVLSA